MAANLLHLDLVYKSVEVIYVSTSEILHIDEALSPAQRKKFDEEKQEVSRNKCLNLMNEASLKCSSELNLAPNLDCDAICGPPKLNKFASMCMRRPKKHETWSLSEFVATHEERSLSESRIIKNSYDEAMLMIPTESISGEKSLSEVTSDMKIAQKRRSSRQSLADVKHIIALLIAKAKSRSIARDLQLARWFCTLLFEHAAICREERLW